MGDHLNSEQLAGYAKRALSPAELIAANDHLAGCEACRQRAGDPEKIEAAFAFLRHDLETQSQLPPAHLEYEQLEAYVDNEMDKAGREIVDSHVDLCRMCRDELRDLREFGVSLGTRQAAPHVQEHLEAVTMHGSVETFWEKLSHFWRYPVYLAGVSSAVAVVIVVAVIAPTMRRSHPIAGVPSTPIGAGAESRQQLQTPAELAGLIGKTETLLGSASEGARFTLLAPVGTFVEDVQPTFRWQSLTGATSYKVTIFDAALNEVAASPAVSGTEWKSSMQLERGKVYLWQVSATKNGQQVVAPAPPAPEAKFELLDLSQANELEQLKREQPNAHLALGRAYASRGVLDEAEREFRLVPDSNADYALAQKFIHNLEALRNPGH